MEAQAKTGATVISRRIPILLSGSILATAALFGTAARANDEGKLSIEVGIHGLSLEGRPQCVTSAWLGHGMARANLTGKLYVPGKPFDLAAADTFAIEVEARESLATIWSELKAADSECGPDPYLDALLSVHEAGFLREYVWKYLRSQAWQRPPGDLRASAFEEWAQAHLKDHAVETNATVRIGSADGK